jgi:hypothetical protein
MWQLLWLCILCWNVLHLHMKWISLCVQGNRGKAFQTAEKHSKKANTNSNWDWWLVHGILEHQKGTILTGSINMGITMQRQFSTVIGAFDALKKYTHTYIPIRSVQHSTMTYEALGISIHLLSMPRKNEIKQTSHAWPHWDAKTAMIYEI